MVQLYSEYQVRYDEGDQRRILSVFQVSMVFHLKYMEILSLLGGCAAVVCLHSAYTRVESRIAMPFYLYMYR